MKTTEAVTKITEGAFEKEIKRLYCCGEKEAEQRGARLVRAVGEFEGLYGAGREIAIFSAPGRTEVGGNHTDHQGGRVLAAAVNLDVIAVVSPTDDGTVRVKSAGFPEDVVKLDTFEPVVAERGHSASLLRGVCAGFAALGYKIGGFSAYTTSEVFPGSGLSSSAAFEVLLGTIVNHLYCGGKVEPLQVAMIGRKAENAFFGKPCGLMDQAASAVGGFTMLDFRDSEKPVAQQIPFDFAKSGFRLCMINTRGNHSDLTPDYAAIPQEMREVAGYFGKDVLSEVNEEDFYTDLGNLRSAVGDRAALRAIHFFEENARVLKEADALRKNDFGAFRRLVLESGQSSFMYLQNVYSPCRIREQGVALALALCDRLLGNRGGAWRVHGGGFAGTVQTYVPADYLTEFTRRMEAVFGEGACLPLSVRPDGGVRVL